jgi:hypothetical protein
MTANYSELVHLISGYHQCLELASIAECTLKKCEDFHFKDKEKGAWRTSLPKPKPKAHQKTALINDTSRVLAPLAVKALKAIGYKVGITLPELPLIACFWSRLGCDVEN